jgi:transposase-like protein
VSNPYGKRYSAEFKRDAVAPVNASPERTVNELARKSGVSPEGCAVLLERHEGRVPRGRLAWVGIRKGLLR